MSSIRLYILAALADQGEMHGHQLKQLAEIEHVHLWTDISVGALYGAIKRLAAEGLIEEARVEREGAYPERQVWRITHAGEVSLAALRSSGLREIVTRPDPFDLAMTRLDLDRLDQLPAVLEARLASLRALVTEKTAHVQNIAKYLTATELVVIEHGVARLRAEVAWHEELLSKLPGLVADELERKEN